MTVTNYEDTEIWSWLFQKVSGVFQTKICGGKKNYGLLVLVKI